MQTHYLGYIGLTAALALSACASLPNSSLEDARNDYNIAQNNPDVPALAGTELKQASDALTRADDAWRRNENPAQVDQLAYLTKQRVAITQEAARLKAAENETAKMNAERNRTRLAARSRDTDAANLKAEASQRRLEDSEREAAAQQRRAQDAEMRTSRLETELKDLAARKTERGMVVTFGDLLFDTNMAQIKSGGMRNVQKLADVLKQHPERNVLIEGFTDNVGAGSHNQLLSNRRANAVRLSLLEMGIGNERLSRRGYGETFPVASNDTTSGRQLNRRVEVVISDDNGQIVPR